MHDFYIPEHDIEAQFLDFLRLNNCEPLEYNFSLQMDGQIHRYRIQGDNHGAKTGAYCLFNDSWPAGWCQNWREGCAVSWSFSRDGLNDDLRRAIDDKKYNELLKKSKAHQDQLRKEMEAMQLMAAERARILCESLPEAPYVSNHPYAIAKRIYSYGLKLQMDNNTSILIVPMRNIDGRIVSLQSIYEDGRKKFYPDSSTKGAFFSIALDTIQDKIPILIGEGMATMSSVYELTSLPCVAAMNCGNIKTVAEAFKKKYPNNPILIMADNDHKTKGNPGRTAAENAVKELGLNGFIMPDFTDDQDGTDWNDFYAIHDEDYTREILMAEINEKKLTEGERKERDHRITLSEAVHLLDPDTKLPPQEFIGGLFPRGFVTLLVAPSGTGKTVFMQKMVSDLSLGGSIFDGFAEKEPVRKCLVFAGEAGYEMLLRRGASMKWAINPQNVPVVDQHEFEMKDLNIMLDEPEGWENICRLQDMYKPDIIFFDTFTSFHEKDENKATDIKPIIKNLAKLARAKNLSIVIVHHSRKRTAKERSLSLNQDDVIGSSVFNRLVGLIIGIEPMKEDEKTLLVRPLKTWFSAFMPFTYKLTEDLYGGTSMQTDLAPSVVNNSKIAVWNYLVETFGKEEWFSPTQIVLSEINPPVTIHQLRRILANFVSTGKLQKRGSTRDTEYSLKDLRN